MKYRWYVLLFGVVLGGLGNYWYSQTGIGSFFTPGAQVVPVSDQQTGYAGMLDGLFVAYDTSPDPDIVLDGSDSEGSALAPVSRPWKEPMVDASGRVTKKPFGVYIAPESSPVDPERFRGFHTGTDFEVSPEEERVEVAIVAVCTGSLLSKRVANGYGGVAVQLCQLDGSDVTVLYGHLDPESIKPDTGNMIEAGQVIGWLGEGGTVETDGERKHLHLSVHRGSRVNYLGYVQRESDLNDWIDPLLLLPAP